MRKDKVGLPTGQGGQLQWKAPVSLPADEFVLILCGVYLKIDPHGFDIVFIS